MTTDTPPGDPPPPIAGSRGGAVIISADGSGVSDPNALVAFLMGGSRPFGARSQYTKCVGCGEKLTHHPRQRNPKSGLRGMPRARLPCATDEGGIVTDFTLHSDPHESADAWRGLLANGGYQIYADAEGNLHGIRLTAIVSGVGINRTGPFTAG